MATIEFRLSNKIQQDGRAEILIRFFHGRTINQRAKTEIFVSPDFFEYYIDKAKTEKAGVHVPPRAITATMDEAEKFGFILRDSGEIVVNNRRLRTPDVVYHEQAKAQLDDLIKLVLERYNEDGQDKVSANSDWLRMVIDQHNHPEKYIKEEKHDFFDFTDEFLSKKHYVEQRDRAFRVLFRDIARYVGFVNATDKERKEFTFNIDKVTKEDIEDFRDYLRNERQLSEEYPKLFADLMKHYPANIKKGDSAIHDKGENAIIDLMKRLRTYFSWLNFEHKTSNDPFKEFVIGSTHYGKPYYITIDERNKIAEADLATAWSRLEEGVRLHFSLTTLQQQRDIFVFQCFVGCRVGDLMRLTEKNIINGELQYIPNKTKDDGVQSVTAVVPLHPKAMALVKKYKGVDKQGRLFPYISSQEYNNAIKMIFTLAGVTRDVVIRNPTTGKQEIRPINEIASSHLARRTFVGNAYLKAPDPSIIGAMSGHVDGSKAFQRYRNIEESTKRAIIDQLG